MDNRVDRWTRKIIDATRPIPNAIRKFFKNLLGPKINKLFGRIKMPLLRFLGDLVPVLQVKLVPIISCQEFEEKKSKKFFLLFAPVQIPYVGT